MGQCFGSADAEELPFVGHAFEVVGAPVFEGQVRAGGEVSNGSAREHVARSCERGDTSADVLETLRVAGRIRPLEPAGELAADTLRGCSHIVGLMGHEPIAGALTDGADLVLAGRATDTALSAALPLLRGFPPGPVWHAAKIAECGTPANNTYPSSTSTSRKPQPMAVRRNRGASRPCSQTPRSRRYGIRRRRRYGTRIIIMGQFAGAILALRRRAGVVVVLARPGRRADLLGCWHV
jgi:hypothetical protein